MRQNPDDGQWEFVLSQNPATHDVAINQKDVREVQLGKAALATGISLLMNHLDLNIDDLDNLFVSGAFGNHIDLAAAQRIGLLPACDPTIVDFVGNTAIIGASMCLLSDPLRHQAEQIVTTIEHVEIAEDETFQNTFIDSMAF